MGTGSSSNTTQEDDVRNRLNSGDFQKISPPSSPSIEAAASINPNPTDEMSYSGILVENPGTEASTTPAAAFSPASPTKTGASFAADLTTPPVSNRSKNRNNKAASALSKEQPRRIVKATPPPSSSEVVDTLGTSNRNNDNDNDVDSPAGVLHAHASPIGANAATEMLEESIEKNASKNKRMERVTNKQKSDREKLLQEKRRRQQPTNSDKKPEANPFSRFLRAFSVDANPTHKRKESTDAIDDSNKRLKFGFNDENNNAAKAAASASEEEESSEDSPSYYSSWIAVASVATIAVLVVAMVRGGKKK